MRHVGSDSVGEGPGISIPHASMYPLAAQEQRKTRAPLQRPMQVRGGGPPPARPSGQHYPEAALPLAAVNSAHMVLSRNPRNMVHAPR